MDSGDPAGHPLVPIPVSQPALVTGISCIRYDRGQRADDDKVNRFQTDQGPTAMAALEKTAGRDHGVDGELRRGRNDRHGILPAW